MIIREIYKSEIYLLEDFLYYAIYQKEGDIPLNKDIIFDPSLFVYIEDFGKKSDNCLVCELNGKLVGAAWTRVLGDKGFGSIEKSPELAISVLPDARRLGIGNRLLKEMLELLRKKGYKIVSLYVQKKNYAFNLYKKVGFKLFKETIDEVIMIKDL